MASGVDHSLLVCSQNSPKMKLDDDCYYNGTSGSTSVVYTDEYWHGGVSELLYSMSIWLVELDAEEEEFTTYI